MIYFVHPKTRQSIWDRPTCRSEHVCGQNLFFLVNVFNEVFLRFHLLLEALPRHHWTIRRRARPKVERRQKDRCRRTVWSLKMHTQKRLRHQHPEKDRKLNPCLWWTRRRALRSEFLIVCTHIVNFTFSLQEERFCEQACGFSHSEKETNNKQFVKEVAEFGIGPGIRYFLILQRTSKEHTLLFIRQKGPNFRLGNFQAIFEKLN